MKLLRKADIPRADLVKAVLLIRFRTENPTIDSSVYVTFSEIAKIVGIVNNAIANFRNCIAFCAGFLNHREELFAEAGWGCW